MALKNLRNRIVAFLSGVIVTLGVGIAWGGLETGTYISDLVATNPLSSDLASTADDHLRLIKSTVKATFPNINNAVTVTDEVLNGVPTGSANPTGTIGLTAVNGSATTYLRSDGAPALSQAIAPTWTAHHIFSNSWTSGNPGAATISAAVPYFELDESDAAADNRRWTFNMRGTEQFLLQAANDARTSFGTVFSVDRTGTTVDRVHFPFEASGGVAVGTTVPTLVNSARLVVNTATAGTIALQISNPTATSPTIYLNNAATSGDNVFISLQTESTGLGTTRGSIDYNRGGGVTRYNTTSDIRLKKNFKPSPSARRVIECIQIEAYDWKETGYHVDHGLVAQRLNKCAPYAVKSSDDPAIVWGVDPSKLVPALIKYVQEQDARIADLERRLH